MQQDRVNLATATVAPPAIVADIAAVLAANENPAPLPSARVDRTALASAMQLATIVTEKRNTIPILSNVLLREHGGGLMIETTDLDLTARVTIPATVGAGFALAVPAHMFRDMLRKSGADTVALDITKQPEKIEHKPANAAPWYTVNPGRVAVRLGASNGALSTALPADWPKDREFAAPATFTVDALTFCNALRRARFAISTEETRYYLNGIYLHAIKSNGVQRYNGNPGALRMVATDGHRLAQVDMAMPEGAADMPGVIVPSKAVDCVIAMFGTKPRKAKKGETAAPSVMLTVSVGPAGIIFSSGNVTLISKLIDGTFPDYGRVIPLGNPHRLTVDLGELAAAVDRVSTVSSERGRAVKFSIEGNRLTLTVQNPDAGDTREQIECDWSGDPMDIGFNGRYFADILEQVGGERVTLMLADPGSPTLVRAADNSGPLFVLMPMRV
jgi:DNA polymerase-3 subunit beta